MQPKFIPSLLRVPTLGGLALLAGITFFVTPSIAQNAGDSIIVSGLFELGDGIEPAVPGIGDILGSEQSGPDWDDLFTADRALKDEYPENEYGEPVGNGVPDYIDLYGGQWAVFTADDILHDSTFVVSGSETLVYSGRRVAAEHDLGNAYFYSTLDSEGRQALFVGVERLASGDSWLEFEINQAHVRLGHGPPWKITGGRSVDDLLFRLTFDAGDVASLEVMKWAVVDPEQESFDWVPLETVSGESCNVAGTICAMCNGFNIDGGPWANFDTTGDPEEITAGRFTELGANLSALLGSQPDYKSIQLRTPQDIAFGHFSEGS